MTTRTLTETTTHTSPTYALHLRPQTIRERLDHLINEIQTASFLDEEERDAFDSAIALIGEDIEQAMAGILCLVVERAFGRLAEEGGDTTLEVLDRWQDELYRLLQEQLGNQAAQYISMYRQAIQGVATLQKKVIREIDRGDKKIQALYDEANVLMRENYEGSCRTRKQLQELQKMQKKDVSRISSDLQGLEERAIEVQRRAVEVAARSLELFARGSRIEKSQVDLYKQLQQALGDLNV